MKKWIALAVLLAVLLLGYVAAGPFLTVDAIGDAVQAQDTDELAQHVDFVSLRGNLKAQLDDYLVRQAGPEMQSSALGALAVRIASGLASGTVDTMVTPGGLGGLMEGRNLWQRVTGERPASDPYGTVPPTDPLRDADYAYESLSRFTATVHDDRGEPLVFVFTREGLDWKLSNIRLPLGPAETPGR